ncbi:MAG TPA: P1 family peptidase [Gaiellales bacterium]|nr:P1 family peptidase [Gaiellales bacterium]
MQRWRDIGGPVGLLPTGARNAITDVRGVRVGHAQAASGEATGVSVVIPPELPARAGVDTVNGVGELTKKLEIDEWGIIESPVWLCGTHAVGTVYHGAVEAAGGTPDNTVIPVVGECDDGSMGDSRTVTAADVRAALADAGQEVAEGTVGAGTGMTCFDFAGGIGTASRVVGEHAVGVLLLCNFGDRERLTVGGLRFDPVPGAGPSAGSCIAVCATDAPLTALQLRRLALRPLLGLAKAGSYASNGSGEIGIAFTVTREQAFRTDLLSPLFAAAYEAAEEAVYNCLVAARPGVRRDGSPQEAFPKHLVKRP